MADPVTLALIGTSTALGVSGAIAEGKAAEQAAKFQAKSSMASGTRAAAEATRAGDIVMSDARAAMAAGGGSASDAGAIETLGKIGAESEYNALASLYEGRQAGEIAKYEGKIKKKAANTRALTTLLSGGAGAYKAYKTPMKAH